MAEAKKEAAKLPKSKTNNKKKNATEFFEYKGKPLVRCGNTIYYGHMADPYVIKMQIKSKTTENDMEIADKVSIQLLTTQPMANPKKQIVKSSERPNLYLAIDIADAWLERYLRDYVNKLK